MAEKNTAVIGFEKQIWDWLLHRRSDFEIEEIVPRRRNQIQW